MEQTTSRTPFFVVLAIALGAIVFGLFAVTIGAGIGVFVVFVLVVVALSFIGGALYRIYVSAWLKWAEMKYKQEDLRFAHQRSLLELEMKYNRHQIAAPKETVREWNPDVEKWRMAAVEYVALTVDTTEYGPYSDRLISANKAQDNALFKSAGRAQNALDFLTKNMLVCSVGTGDRVDYTKINDGLTARELLDLISPHRIGSAK
jgi:hypothetical protein